MRCSRPGSRGGGEALRGLVGHTRPLLSGAWDETPGCRSVHGSKKSSSAESDRGSGCSRGADETNWLLFLSAKSFQGAGRSYDVGPRCLPPVEIGWPLDHRIFGMGSTSTGRCGEPERKTSRPAYEAYEGTRRNADDVSAVDEGWSTRASRRRSMGQRQPDVQSPRCAARSGARRRAGVGDDDSRLEQQRENNSGVGLRPSSSRTSTVHACTTSVSQ